MKKDFLQLFQWLSYFSISQRVEFRIARLLLEIESTSLLMWNVVLQQVSDSNLTITPYIYKWDLTLTNFEWKYI